MRTKALIKVVNCEWNTEWFKNNKNVLATSLILNDRNKKPLVIFFGFVCIVENNNGVHIEYSVTWLSYSESQNEGIRSSLGHQGLRKMSIITLGNFKEY